MRDSNHPALRPTRYHWAAGLHPLHWVPALAGWGLTTVLAVAVPASGNLNASLAGTVVAMASLGWSMTWLLLVPVMPAFRRVVDSKLRSRFELDFAYQAEALVQGSPTLRPYLRNVSQLRDKARSIMQRRFGAHDPFAQDNLAKLDKLAVSYVQLLSNLSDYDDYLSVVDAQSLEQEIVETKRSLAETSEDLRQLRERQLLLLQNRLSRYRKVEARLRLLKEEAASIETTIKLLADQAMSAPEGRDVWHDIDTVLDNIKESELLSADLAVFDEFERTASRSSGTKAGGK